MCAAVVTPPLRELQHYNPHFKVEVCLGQPLWSGDNSLHEVMSLCSVLELLCKKEAAQMQRDKRSADNLSTAFKDKSRIITDKLHSLSVKLPTGGILAYIQSCSLAEVYPRATQFIRSPSQVPTNVSWSAMDDHLAALSSLQKVHGLASQINSDILTLSNHKYIAHQMALLHQSLAALAKVSYMSDFKQSIEEQFTAIKRSINEAQDRGENPYLPQDMQQWIQELTSRLISVCRSLPAEIQDCVQPAAQILASNV